MIRYQVIDKRTGEPVDHHSSVVVTPDGKVSWWDEGQGWVEDDLQTRFSVVLLEYTAEPRVCTHKVTKLFRRVSVCVGCGQQLSQGST